MFGLNWLTGIFAGSATQQKEGPQSAAPTKQGVASPKVVDEETALQISVVWRCVRILSEVISSLPIKVFEVTDGEGYKEVNDQPNNPLWFVLTQSPNRYQTTQEWLETMCLNLVLHGNSFAQIERNNKGELTGLLPLPAQNMEVRLLADGSRAYFLHNSAQGRVSAIAEQNILHIKLFGNGIVGLSPLGYAKSSMGLAQSAEEYSAKFFVNGGKPSGVLTIDKVLNKDQRTQIREQFASLTEGSENSHRMFILEAGVKYQAIQANPDELQMIESRRFQVEDISRFFGVPLFLLNSTENSTTWGSGLEQIMTGFYLLTLRPYLTRFEQCFRKQVMTAQQRRRYRVEFDFDDLLRADSTTRANLDQKLVASAINTINEVRAKRNLPPVEGGDQPLVQGAYVPLDLISEVYSNKPAVKDLENANES